MSADELKRQAAARALELVRPGMRLGLGTGSTAKHFVDLLGRRVAEGLDVLCVATSEATQAQAVSLNIPMSTLDETPALDLTVDGADEIDPQLRLIKGGGAALLREKIVAAASARMVVIADDGKLVPTLGRFPLPIEVVPFGLEATRRAVATAIAASGAAGDIALRRRPDGGPLVTDGGHFILDARLGAIERPELLAQALNMVPGVVEHGLFIGLASGAILAGAGGLRLLGRIE
ncbi:ribose-5-phosphate isomerase RpiA [Bosea minatitlanensis]|uniref:Ribose-5-phosphate isomerase A n=1 Tax=Bosea minatitlanensis TaxID=128782 RepID=A0ABW0F0E4_9HYPH|nr:ribose-5-phosphate isomerase RpiA [Bosea minatitlanensis]MCT4492680.1 ribose-5-phosphate isomerase RpiA [Bosea minatitlanensis]